MGNLTNWIWIIFIIIWIISDCAVLSIQSNDVGAGHGFTYSRDRLLFFRGSIHCQLNPSILIPPDITLTSGLRRKRGRRGGVRCRLRRRAFKTPLPSIILSNVRSLKNKLDLLHAKCLMDASFREACVLAVTESWLDESVPDAEVALDGFELLRADRTSNSGKLRGGGVCMYINSQWCTNIKVHKRICNPDLELLTLSAYAFYLPREFSTVVLSCVYVPPSANVKAAAEQVAHNTQAMLGKYPDAPVLILGDFNSCQLDYVLPAFKQYVDVPTRFNKTIDLCYSNIQEAYKARALPPLGLADHNVIHLLPVYKQRLKQHKPMIYSTLQWSEDAIARLQGCLACTDWDVFEGELDEQTLVISDYIKFCIDTLIPAKTIKTYPNSKSWINPQIKHIFYKKQLAFRQNSIIKINWSRILQI